jgi:translation elongation factor EF-Tu-like GTPase
MIKVKANIKLYKNSRKTPFHSGYRPMFNFIEEMKTSGKIDLIEKDEFFPGEEGEVNITFINKKYLGDDFDIGKKFFFGEGEEPLGEGKITEVL